MLTVGTEASADQQNKLTTEIISLKRQLTEEAKKYRQLESDFETFRRKKDKNEVSKSKSSSMNLVIEDRPSIILEEGLILVVLMFPS
jgi:hypothetical protein